MADAHKDGPHNYSTLQRNVLDGLSTDAAKAEFFWACEQPWADRYLYRPEEYAQSMDRVALVTSDDLISRHARRIKSTAPGPCDASGWNMLSLDNPNSLRSFIVKRQRGQLVREMEARNG